MYFDMKNFNPDMCTFENAIENGRLDVLKWYWVHNDRQDFSRESVQIAYEKGYLDVVAWINTHYCFL